jgi:hypothetical protein
MNLALKKGILGSVAANVFGACLGLSTLVGTPAAAQVPVDGVTVVAQLCDWRMIDDMGASGGYLVYMCLDQGSGTWAPPGSVYTPPLADSMGSLHAIHRAEALAAIMGLCKRRGEDDFAWISRSQINCVSVFVNRPQISDHCRTVAAELTISAGVLGRLDPAPPACPF